MADTTPVREFIRRSLLYDPDVALDDDTVLFPDLVDSLGIMEVIDFIEDHYDLEIEDDELLTDNVSSLRALGALIDRKRP